MGSQSRSLPKPDAKERKPFNLIPARRKLNGKKEKGRKRKEEEEEVKWHTEIVPLKIWLAAG